MVFFIILIILAFLLSHPQTKGYLGESSVNFLLARLDKNEYKLYKDLYILKDDGSTAQLDHIVVSRFGVFVIETKNYGGWIFGDEFGKNWTQVIYKKKNRFFNPILQNRGHIKALCEYLNLDQEDWFHSVIVFTTRATLKKVTTDTPVVYSAQLVRHIKKFQTPLLSREQVQMINNRLNEVKVADRTVRKEHVEMIRMKQGTNQKRLTSTKAEYRICKRCGAVMVKRSGRHGEFYGCETFPKCKYTESYSHQTFKRL